MKRTLLLGAGAATECYDPPLTTLRVTEAVTDPARWEDLLKRYTALMDKANHIECADVLDLLRRLRALDPAMTFEELIECIDKVSSFHFTGRKLFHDLLAVLRAKKDYPHTVWTDVPFLARQLIAEFITGHRRAADFQSFVVQQRSFLAALQSQGPVCIYSLNYDDTLYESTEGLSFDNGFRGAHFSVYDFFSAKNAIAFPHGHVRYLHGGRDGITYDPDATAATRKRFERLRDPHDETLTVIDHPYAYVFDTFLVTGQMKDHALDRNPYAATYQRLAQDLSASDELIIVGYGLGDLHLNRLITNYLAQQPTHRIIVVTMKRDVLDVYAGYRPGGWSYTLLTTLGINSLPLTGSGWEDLHYRHLDDVALLNERGYGTVYPKITYFKDGYRSFLSSYAAVLEEASAGKTGL